MGMIVISCSMSLQWMIIEFKKLSFLNILLLASRIG